MEDWPGIMDESGVHNLSEAESRLSEGYIDRLGKGPGAGTSFHLDARFPLSFGLFCPVLGESGLPLHGRCNKVCTTLHTEINAHGQISTYLVADA